MAGEDSDNQPSSPASPSSAGFNTDQLPFSTSQNSENFSDEEAEVDPHIIRDEPDEPEEEEEEGDGEDLFNDNFMDDYRKGDEQDQYEPNGLDDSVDDERDLGQIMLDRRAADAVLDARESRFANRKLPHLLHDNDSDDWNYRPSKRSRTTVPPRGNGGDPDGNPSSPGTSQPDISAPEREREREMAGEDSDNQPSSPASPSSAGFNTDQLPFSTSQNSENFSDEEAEVDPHIIRDEPDEPEEEEEEGDGEDLFNDNFMDDYKKGDEQDQYEPNGLDDSVDDERDLGQIMLDRRAADAVKKIIRDEPDESEEEDEEGYEEDLFNDNFMDDYGKRDEQDQYEPNGLDDSVDDERDGEDLYNDNFMDDYGKRDEEDQKPIIRDVISSSAVIAKDIKEVKRQNRDEEDQNILLYFLFFVLLFYCYFFFC